MLCKRRKRLIGVFGALVSWWVVSVACRPANPGDNSTSAKSGNGPAVVLEWMGRGGGFSEWGGGGPCIYAESVEPSILDVWRWKEGSLEKRAEVPLPRCLGVSWMEPDRCIFGPVDDDDGEAIIMLKVRTGDDEDHVRWSVPHGWYCDMTQPSAAGHHVAVRVGDTTRAPGYASEHPRLQIGLVGPEADGISWVTTLVGECSGADINVRVVLPSDGGSYIAVGGWDNSLAMIDVHAKETLWVRKPGANAVFYAAFSPDAKVVYTGGTEGIVFALDVKTGETLSRWYATPTGRSEYGHRISCLSASPDGRWVAAGTGPEGLVFVGSTAESKLVKVLNHGGSTVLLVQFSPDSKALASFVPGTLKIWDVSLWGDDAGN